MELNTEKWTEEKYLHLTEYLYEISDEKYREFHSSLVPGSNEGFILGIRMPVLRNLGKEISKSDAKGFLNISKTELYEQRMLSAIVTGLIKTNSFEDFITLCDNFIPQIQNWALCDCFCAGLKQVKKYKDEFFEYIMQYLHSENEWAVRAAFVIMLDYYLEDKYIDEVFKRSNSIDSNSYYVYTAQAWMLATAFANFPEKTKEYLLECTLNEITFNKTIRKCIESRRISDDDKKYLKSLKKH